MTLLARTAARILRLLAALAAIVALAALLIGVPWGLITFIGWPLPDHIPTGDEIEATLLNPLSVTLLLNILACIAWPTWLVFAFDVARCVPDAVRGVRPPAIGPMHAVAGVLVAAAVLGLLHPRVPAATGDPLHPVRPVSIAVSTQLDAGPTERLGGPAPTTQQSTASEQGTVVVQPPQGGIYESLYRIAQRELGDGNRWPELFHLNEGRLQPDGRALTDPHLIRPGWVLQLPGDAIPRPTAPPPAPATPQPPARAEPPAPVPAPHHQAPEAAPERHQPSAPVTTTSGTAISLWSGGLVAAALASAVTLAMVTRRRRRMRTYTPGSGDRTPPPAPAPAVHALRLAYDEARLDEADRGGDDGADPVTIDDAPQAPSTFDAEEAGSTTVEIGVRDERARALDLAAVHGLGLTGAGAQATARSLLVHLLATTRATVVIPADDAQALMGADLPDSPRLRITDDLDTAVTELAARAAPVDTASEDTSLHTVLVARADRPHAELQSVLDTGSATGTAGILLGHWPAGATVRVRADGIVAAASPTIQDLRDSRLFSLGATDTRDLLTLLADTEPGSHMAAEDTPAEPDHDDPELIEEPVPAADAPPGANADPVDEHGGNGQGSQPGTEPENGLDDETAAPKHDIPYNAEDPAEQGTNAAVSPPRSLVTATDEPPDIADSSEVPELIGVAKQSDEPPECPLTLSIFGSVTMTWHSPSGEDHDLTSMLAPKHKALLVFLALHPTGTTREAVREALWPEARGRRPFNAFYASLSQIRKVLSQATNGQVVDLIDQHDEQVALTPDLVEVDYWRLHQAEHERHIAATDEQRMLAWSRIAATYRGEVADGMSALWLDGPREAAHRAVVDALAGMAAHYRGHDPQRQLQLLEHARLLNPENEDIYRDIMRVQAQLGLTDAISRTVQLLTTTLAEIGVRPDPNTLTLARALQARQHRVAS
ncbi:hypothetical protein HFP15_22055 [Amycolatopsis sp. K13G38]|uniref:Bacterial transcriptional activator domain-containing protein n=1 Tax=Amycolatopsis acididurans TaxID=2724524 RepID=A0ABX1J710_9PSEU|nr:hypothetical protein [Amycolatopsis acididurans]NKQ55572.1 hypothetical protein [Amycolatopsis acididurans]